jgi:hypothetical protein
MRAISAGLLTSFLVACPGGVTPRVGFLAPGESVTHALIQVHPYDGQPDVWRIRSTATLGDRSSTSLLPEGIPSDSLGFPATYTVKAPEATGTLQLLVEALDQDGVTVGRARGAVQLEPNGGVVLSLTLRKACAHVLDCSDAVFCNGEEVCVEGMCAPASQVPCPRSPFQCVSQTCVEESRTCDIRVDHDRCAPILNQDGTTDTTYCDPVAGCVRGQPCVEDADCPDPYTCNGSERCVSGRCIGGIPPNVDDDNPCTLDSCAEPGGAMHVDAADGNRCGEGLLCVGGSCVATRCGDSVVDLESGERCDDGPSNSDEQRDACRTNCRPAWCGDGVVDSMESCDGTPGCRDDCTRCGDGVKQVVEGCDNGTANSESPDAVCRPDCTPRRCGDGVVDTGEQCDDGIGNSAEPNATCRPDCMLKRCGDGVQDDGEACDFGTLNADEPNSPCLTSCVLLFCGDGIVSAGETCDFGDANADSPDAPCRRDCRARRCGDRVVDTGEQCDDGAGNSAEPNATCRPDCMPKRCGDGVQDDGEACDFGLLNADEPNAPCLTTCVVPFCGDGIISAGEQCDLGELNSQSPDAA